jgi:hypothetical protein
MRQATPAELEAAKLTVQGLEAELQRCPASKGGYQEADYLRSRIAAHRRYLSSERNPQ